MLASDSLTSRLYSSACSIAAYQAALSASKDIQYDSKLVGSARLREKTARIERTALANEAAAAIYLLEVRSQTPIPSQATSTIDVSNSSCLLILGQLGAGNDVPLTSTSALEQCRQKRRPANVKANREPGRLAVTRESIPGRVIDCDGACRGATLEGLN